jgi:hypothetical protein
MIITHIYRWGDSMNTKRVKMMTVFMGILLLLTFLYYFYMYFVSGGYVLGFSIYLIGLGLSLSFLSERGISKTINSKKFEISFKQIRWARVIEFAVFTWWVLYGNMQLAEGRFFPDFLDWLTWVLLAMYALSFFVGNYMARQVLYPQGDFRQAFYDALSEKGQ